MKLKEFDITLDIKKTNQVPCFEVVAGDFETNALNIALTDGTPYSLDGLNAEIVFAKPDGTIVVQDESNGVVIEDNIIRCTLSSNTIAVSGTVFAEVRVLQDAKVLTSPRFRFYVRNPILNDKTVASSNQFPMLVQATENAKEATQNAIDAAQNAVIAAEKASTAAQQANEAKENIQAQYDDLAGEGRTTETVKGVADELMLLKTDYATYKDSNNLKIAKVEKDLNDYQQTMSAININQEATQQATGYGVVSLSKNAGQGPMDVKVEGLTLQNELDYNPVTWEEWVINGTVTKDSSGIEITFNETVPQSYASIVTNLKPNTNYGILYYIASNNLSTKRLLLHNALTGAYINAAASGQIGNQKLVITTQSSITNNWFRFIQELGDGGLKVKIRGVRVFELHPGSEIESDFETLSADELAMKYPYVQGGELRNTSGTYRVKSVGKNLFDASRTWYYGTYSNGIVQAANGLSNIATFPVTLTNANRSIFRVYLCKENTPYTVSISNFTSTDINISLTQYASIESAANIINALASTSAAGTNKEAALTTVSGGNIMLVAISGNYYPVKAGDIVINGIGRVQLEEGTTATAYEPYTESEQYVNGPELRSLPNGVADSIDDGKLIKMASDWMVLTGNDIGSHLSAESRESVYVGYTNPIVTDGVPNEINSISAISQDGDYISTQSVNNELRSITLSNNRFYINIEKSKVDGMSGETLLEKLKNYLNLYPISLCYQLATPEIQPVQTSGSVHSYPSGTVYIEPFVVDAGIYTDKIEMLHEDLPIKAIEKASKVDFDTGLETELDITAAVIAEDKLSFTHPDLTSGDIVFFVYEHGAEGTIPETEISYYDSRYVIKGEDDKFYQWEIEAKLVEGVITPSIKLVEV